MILRKYFLLISAVCLAAATGCRTISTDSNTSSENSQSISITGSYGQVTVLADAGVLQAMAAQLTVTPALKDDIDLSKATGMEFVEPKIGTCKLLDKMVMASQRGTKLMVQLMGNASCKSFMTEAGSSLTVKFSGVPTLNGGQKLDSVTIKLTK